MGAVLGVGARSFLQGAKEATYSVAPANATFKIELVNSTITPRLFTIEDPSMTNAQMSRRFIGQGGQYYQWSARIRFGYEGVLEVLRMFFPTYSSAVVDTIRDHTFKEGINGQGLHSYTLERSEGDIPVGKVTRMTGCFGTSLRISGQAGTGENAMLMADIEGVAATLATDTTPMGGTPAFPTPLGIIYHQLLRTGTNLKDGSTNPVAEIRMTNWEMALSIPHDMERWFFGSVNADYPVRSGPIDCTISIEEEWNDKTLLDALKNNTATALRFFWQHPTTIGTTSKRELEITANAPTASEAQLEIPGFTGIKVKGGYRLAYHTGDASFMVVRVRSTEAALPA